MSYFTADNVLITQPDINASFWHIFSPPVLPAAAVLSWPALQFAGLRSLFGRN